MLETIFVMGFGTVWKRRKLYQPWALLSCAHFQNPPRPVPLGLTVGAPTAKLAVGLTVGAHSGDSQWGLTVGAPTAKLAVGLTVGAPTAKKLRLY